MDKALNPDELDLTQIEKNEIGYFQSSEYIQKYPTRKDTLLIADCMAKNNISEGSYKKCKNEIEEKKNSSKVNLILTIDNNEDLKNYVGTYIMRSQDGSITNKFFTHSDGQLYSLKQFPIGTWDVTRVTDMSNLFENGSRYIDIFEGNEYILDSTNFNTDINTKIYNLFTYPYKAWDTRNVTSMKAMFKGASVFNKSISKWNTYNVLNMESMFEDATYFNNRKDEMSPTIETVFFVETTSNNNNKSVEQKETEVKVKNIISNKKILVEKDNFIKRLFCLWK